MNTTPKAVMLAGSLLVFTSAFAGEQTVTLQVDGMTCAACPYIVKRTLVDVDGVTSVDVSFAEKIAVVTYDDSKTEVAALTLATTDMGFPSSAKEKVDNA